MTSDDVNLLKSLGYTEGSIHYPDDFIYKKMFIESNILVLLSKLNGLLIMI